MFLQNIQMNLVFSVYNNKEKQKGRKKHFVDI